MKKKLVSVVLAAALMCSSSITVFADEKDDRIAELEAQVVEMQGTIDELTKKLEELSPKEDAKANESSDGINFSTDAFAVSYVKHEFGTDVEGNKCLLYYYNFTNTSDQNATAGLSAHVQCFQDGSECKAALSMDHNDSMDNYALNQVQPGGTVEVCQLFALKSDSEITIEASEMLSMSNEKATQVIAVQ